MDVGRLSKVILNSLILTQKVFFFWMEGVVAFRRFRAPVVHKKGGCWLQVAGGCSLQVQINVKYLGGFPGWLLLAGGCSSRLDCTFQVISNLVHDFMNFNALKII